jgi:hypothetical protein
MTGKFRWVYGPFLALMTNVAVRGGCNEYSPYKNQTIASIVSMVFIVASSTLYVGNNIARRSDAICDDGIRRCMLFEDGSAIGVERKILLLRK